MLVCLFTFYPIDHCALFNLISTEVFVFTIVLTEPISCDNKSSYESFFSWDVYVYTERNLTLNGNKQIVLKITFWLVTIK